MRRLEKPLAFASRPRFDPCLSPPLKNHDMVKTFALYRALGFPILGGSFAGWR